MKSSKTENRTEKDEDNRANSNHVAENRRQDPRNGCAVQAHGMATFVGGKVDEDCITCPLHQSRYELETGEVCDWSPFPMLPAYGKLVGSMRKEETASSP